MSKQSEAKAKQFYVPKAIHSVCGNCIHLRYDTERQEAWGQVYIREKNLHCGLGMFAVKKMGTCDYWEEKALA